MRKGITGEEKYIVYLMFASKAFLLPAMILVYVQCGTLDFEMGNVVSGMFPNGAGSTLVKITYILCLLGFAKSAIMPIHGWLPAAMVAPTPVSALLHAVVVVKVGVFLHGQSDALGFRGEPARHSGSGNLYRLPGVVYHYHGVGGGTDQKTISRCGWRTPR